MNNMLPSQLYPVNMRAFQMSDAELFEFCQDNKELRIERDEKKQIFIMSPTGFLSGYYNNKICFQLETWNCNAQLGLVADSSTGFFLPDGSMRSPDAAWVSLGLWATVPDNKKNQFAPICPEFIVELQSESDALKTLQEKMQNTWIKNGAKLAWLICPQTQQTFIYRADGSTETLEGFNRKLSGEQVLPDFELDLSVLKEI